MPFTSGTYGGVANSFNDAVSGTLIDPQDWNELFTDIEAGVNAAAGGVGSAATTDVTSAATTNIGGATTKVVRITGSTGPITSLGTVANSRKYVYFASTPTLTHNATTLILPGGANIVAAAGDAALFISDASGNWRCVSYQRASSLGGTSVLVANEATDTTCFPVFVTAATGDLEPKTNSNLAFNSNTGVLTLTAPVLGTPTSGTLTNCTGLPISTGVAGLGTGIATALAVNTGSAGAPVLFNGAIGTPSSGTLTNCTGLPSIVVANEATDTTCFLLFTTAATGELAPKSNANLAFNSNTGVLSLTNAALTTPVLGTPSSGTLTNCTGLPSIVVANEATDTTCFLLFTTAATGELGPKTNANLAFNSSTGVLTLTSPALTTPTLNGAVTLGSTPYMDWPEISAPATPGANVARMYSKDVGGTTKLYFKDSTGTETDLGAAGGSGAFVLIQTQAASTSASLDFETGLDDTYDAFEFRISSLIPATDDTQLQLQVKVGGSYQTTGYISGGFAMTSGAATAAISLTTAVLCSQAGANGGVGNAAGENYSGVVRFANPEVSQFCVFEGDASYKRGDAALNKVVFGGQYNTAGAVTGIRFLMSSGNITSGRISLYGIAKS